MLRPRSDGRQNLLNFTMNITPAPAGQSEGLDAEGNTFTQIWFNGLWNKLEISTISQAEINRSNPFDYLLTPQMIRLPLSFDPSTRFLLKPYLFRSTVHTHLEDAAAELGQSLVEKASYQTVAVLDSLNTYLHSNLKRTQREEPGILAPEATLAEGQGACRDLASLFVDVCRSLGIPARFVSGYHAGDSTSKEWELHAWAEIYLPGAGWRGYDPTLGLAVGDRHVALAASYDPHRTTPVAGSFRGTGIAAHFETRIEIEDAI